VAGQSQVINGKAFEYAVAMELQRRLQTSIRPGQEAEICRNAFESLTPEFSADLVRAAVKAVDHILELERRRLSSAVPKQIWIASDDRGQQGDVRDVVLETSDGAIGISCKNNHAAFKHSRLSGRVDFVKKWDLDPAGCSEEYWRQVRPIFAELEVIRKESYGTALWNELPDVAGRFYWPVLDAFDKELTRLSEPGSATAATVSKNLVLYIVGRIDFYKVIRRAESVTVQGFNFNGSLATDRTHGPTLVIGVDRLNGGQYSKTVRLNRGFTFNFRIHNASSRVEPSLKFDITAVSLPPTEIYVNHLRVAVDS
jgi:hypothetical protein